MARRAHAGRLAACVLGACTSAWACAPPPDARTVDAPADTITLVDAEGSAVSLPRPASRIVSLVPSATSTLRAIGAERLLVGRTDYDTEAWTDAIPSVGGGLGPSLEAIVALQPDLVVRFAGGQDPRTGPRLDDFGIPHITIRPDRIDDIYAAAKLLGRATGHEHGADSLVSAIRAGLEETAQLVSRWPRQRVAHVLGGTPPWITGPGTYIDEVMRLAGGDNVFSDLGTLYAGVSPEELRSRDIDVVLVSARGAYDEELTPDARIVAIGDALEIPGPDVVMAARAVAEAIHGRPLR